MRDVFAGIGKCGRCRSALRCGRGWLPEYCALSIPAGSGTPSAAAGGYRRNDRAVPAQQRCGNDASVGQTYPGAKPDSASSTLMAEQLTKLRPDRDLQCYLNGPRQSAALSGASTTEFTVSGCWRQQFDWAVIEWNRDNGRLNIRHCAILPDGDSSGLELSYEEVRTNCIPLDSTLYPTEWTGRT